MAAPPEHSLTPTRPGFWILLLSVTLLAGLGVWLTPPVIATLIKPPEVHNTPDVVTEQVDRFVETTMPTVEATALAAEERGGIHHAIYQTRADPLELARSIRQRADEASVELYVSQVDGLDAEIRVYAGARVRHQILLMPTLPTDPQPPRARTLRERPLIALILSGFGDSRRLPITNTDIPLTVAIEPYSPFSLRLAHQAAMRWDEVLLDMTGMGEDVRDRIRLSEALGAVPFVTGVLSDALPYNTLPGTPLGVIVQLEARRTVPMSIRSQWVPAQHSHRRSALETLTRTRILAIQEGAATMTIRVDDPDLTAVLEWASLTTRFRMALVSEVLRADQTRGIGVGRPPAGR